jgi:hypothetical protein
LAVELVGKRRGRRARAGGLAARAQPAQQRATAVRSRIAGLVCRDGALAHPPFVHRPRCAQLAHRPARTAA